ncbi:uncharacterized protein UV8b_04812 [Ustilaginoidea virens]|uniref:Fungal lipase-type domain-containing protein n=1 Tax=Ustilaginoidea virens TaxID=1159556 RepID=A0A063BR37_USTVR|nr:uncharacterized protein UV8b_04812 [Ustilaginoidea virens]QUC20571.1 hypothetical protein UV8b_04812 [Ustilaginoidea virens]GAO15631.1 hypothetical protein UVI_02050620 [Ustilaginoidea virens]
MRRVLAIAGLIPLQAAAAQERVSSNVFDRITRYTSFAAASYAYECPSPPFGSHIIKTFDNEGTDTQATLFHDYDAAEVIIAFRGTSTPQDLDTDLDFELVPLSVVGANCPNCKVHRGFQTAYNSIADQIAPEIRAELEHSGSRLVVTGHSLGGGLAALATASLIGQGFKVTATYTYGEPRNGDAEWAKYISRVARDVNYFRVTHYKDGVPQIPPSELGYVHHGPEYFQSRDANNTASTTFKCPLDSLACSTGQDFGPDPINRSHLTYSNMIIGSSLFVQACGAVFP